MQFAFALLLLNSMPLAAQQPAVSERLDVNIVLLDVIITDRSGHQILGLTAEDFVVKENGVRQTLDSVDYFTSRRLLDNREEKLPFDIERVKEERYMVFFFDKPEGAQMFDQIARARSSVERFIDEDMGGGDLVAIVGHDVRLKVYSDFTSDKNQLKRALRDVATFKNGITKAPAAGTAPSILRNIDLADMMGDTGTVYEGITVLSDALRGIRGRKNLVLFSPGIREPGEMVRDGMLLNTSRFYDPMIEALNASNVTVYAANIFPNPVTDPVFHQTLERMTNDTNGEYLRYAISFNPMLENIEKETAGYYLLTYRVRKPRNDRGFQKVDVTVTNPEFRVKARPGYVYGERD
jgi:VWFA-related protein